MRGFHRVEETEQYVFLGVADATGHGVPGAFVSLVCANALNRAVREEGLESPAQILSWAKALVSELLTREGESLPDGMDIALVRFEKERPWRIEAFFAEWKGERRQMDDVTVVGVRVG